MNIEALKKRLDKRNNNRNYTQDQDRKSVYWKPTESHTIRIIPFQHKDLYKNYIDVVNDPFIELQYYFFIEDKAFLAPCTFGHPDPILEYINQIETNGNPLNKQLASKLKPKSRFYLPIIVRGEEYLGVRFWAFTPRIFDKLGAYFINPEYGDLSDLTSGTDIDVTFIPKEQTATHQFSDIQIMPKRNSSLAFDPNDTDLKDLILNRQFDIITRANEPTYESLKEIFYTWLNESDTNLPGEGEISSSNVESSNSVTRQLTTPIFNNNANTNNTNVNSISAKNKTVDSNTTTFKITNRKDTNNNAVSDQEKSTYNDNKTSTKNVIVSSENAEESFSDMFEIEE